MSNIFTPLDSSKPMYSGSELVLIENFIDSRTCESWVAFADMKAGVQAPVGDVNSSVKATNVNNLGFVADRINLLSALKQKTEAVALFEKVYQRIASTHYGVEFEWFEIPHILRYSKGGNYNFHSDSEAWDQNQKCWVKGVDRDYSCILYLNSEFTGGTLAFPNLNLRVHPRAGLLVIFPSDHRFLHSAEETLSGSRYAMVTWAAVFGTERVMNRPPPHIIKMKKGR